MDVSHPNFGRVLRLTLLFLSVSMVVPYAQASERVSVAAAANLTYVMEPLNAAFEKANPDVVVHSEIGASGSLVSQIENGAPYDIFLSADTEYPRKLIKAGSAQESSFVIFARGRLVLWTTSTGLRMDSVESVLKNEAVRKVAIANPETAPYGRAAMEVLSRMGLSETLKSKIVTGDNITQTAQFVSTGNADIGFVALSLVKSPKLADKGAWLEIPASLYAPIDQAAVLTSRGAASAGALRYIKFLESEDARKVFGAFGYGLPDINPSSATAAGKLQSEPAGSPLISGAGAQHEPEMPDPNVMRVRFLGAGRAGPYYFQ